MSTPKTRISAASARAPRTRRRSRAEGEARHGIARLRQRLQRGQQSSAGAARGCEALLHAAARIERAWLPGHGGVKSVADRDVDLALAALEPLQLAHLAGDVQTEEREE